MSFRFDKAITDNPAILYDSKPLPMQKRGALLLTQGLNSIVDEKQFVKDIEINEPAKT